MLWPPSPIEPTAAMPTPVNLDWDCEDSRLLLPGKTDPGWLYLVEVRFDGP